MAQRNDITSTEKLLKVIRSKQSEMSVSSGASVLSPMSPATKESGIFLTWRRLIFAGAAAMLLLFAGLGGVMLMQHSLKGSISPADRANADVLHPDAKALPAAVDKIKVIGNRDSKRYHLPGMKYYHQVEAYHRVEFASEAEAVRAGYYKAGR